MIAIVIKQLGDSTSSGYRAWETIYEQRVEDKDFNLKTVIATINGLTLSEPTIDRFSHLPPGSVHLTDQQ